MLVTIFHIQERDELSAMILAIPEYSENLSMKQQSFATPD